MVSVNLVVVVESKYSDSDHKTSLANFHKFLQSSSSLSPLVSFSVALLSASDLIITCKLVKFLLFLQLFS